MIEKMSVIVNYSQLSNTVGLLRKVSFQVSFHELAEIVVKLLIHINLFLPKSFQ